MNASRSLNLLMLSSILLIAGPGWARTFPAPAPHHPPIIGHIGIFETTLNDYPDLLARKHDIGFDELASANPILNHDTTQPGQVLLLPTAYILPNAPHEGLVVNLAEKRMYVFEKNKITTFPVGIGRRGWATPLGSLRIISKQKNPRWHPTPDIRKAMAKRGIDLPEFVPPGPDNPLGHYAIRLSKPNYLIHGTNDPYGVGRRSSAGCLRMYPEDIEKLYSMVSVGTPIHIVNQPFKLAKVGRELWLESHHPLQEVEDDANQKDSQHPSRTWHLPEAIETILKESRSMGFHVHASWLRSCLLESSGMPLVLAQLNQTPGDPP